MSLSGPGRNGRSSSRSGHIGLTEDVPLLKKAEKKPGFGNMLVEFIRHPVRYIKAARENRRLAKNFAEQGKGLRDRKVSPGVKSAQTLPHDDLLKGLKVVNEQAEKEHFSTDPEKQDRFLRGARMATGKSDPSEPLIKTEAYLNKRKELINEYHNNLDDVKEKHGALRNSQYKSLHTEDNEEFVRLSQELQEKRHKVRLWSERFKAIPWYASKESRVPVEFQTPDSKRLTRTEIRKHLKASADEFVVLRDKVGAINLELSSKHDQDRYPKQVMERVNNFMSQTRQTIEEGVVARLKEGGGLIVGEMLVVNDDRLKEIYFVEVFEYERKFRKKTVSVIEDMQKKTFEELTEDDFQQYNARQIAGQALNRIMGISKTPEDFQIELKLYEEGKPSRYEQELVEKTGVSGTQPFKKASTSILNKNPKAEAGPSALPHGSTRNPVEPDQDVSVLSDQKNQVPAGTTDQFDAQLAIDDVFGGVTPEAHDDSSGGKRPPPIPPRPDSLDGNRRPDIPPPPD